MTKRAPLTWRQEGEVFALYAHRRRFGRVVRDSQYPSMWRSVMPDGSLSDMSNISWAKNAVLIAAERELEYESRVADTPKRPNKRGVFLEHEGQGFENSARAISDTAATIGSSL
jgi:hypothetical protein